MSTGNESHEAAMNGWTRLYHPRGPQVTLPVPVLGKDGYDYNNALAAVSAALDAGWRVEAPGLEEGEEKETVGWVLKGVSEKDGRTTPFVLLYADNDALTWSFLKVYLNKLDDVEAFEYASKIKLDKLPEYVGNDKPQRGSSQKTDRFIIKAPKPFAVVFKKNPKHDPNETDIKKMKAARVMMRWAEQKPVAEEQQPPTASPKPAPPPQPNPPAAAGKTDATKQAKDDWMHHLAQQPDLDLINTEVMKQVKDTTDRELRMWKWTMARTYAESRGWVFVEEKRRFMDKMEAESEEIPF